MAFDTKGALEAGYSQEEINAYLANKNKPNEELEESSNVEFDTKGALEAGYSQEEIDTYLANKNKPQEKKEEEYDTSIARKYIADPALSLAKGVTQLPDVVSGVADMVVSPLTGGRLSVGKGFEYLEEQLPDALQDLGDTLEQAKSPELLAKREAARKEIDAAEGFVDTAKTTIGTMLENPSLLFDTLFQSLPSTVTGGVVGKTLLKLKGARAAGLTPLGAGAVGEGIVSGGSTAESIRQETEEGVLSAKQSGIAFGSGVLTSIFGKLGGRLSQKFDAVDIDTYLAGGVPAQKAQSKIINAFKSAIIEGTAEELPQSMQEQMAQNIALGKDPMEGVAESAATGFLLGMAMGGGASALLGESNIESDAPSGVVPPENKPEYTEDESINTDSNVFEEPQEELTLEDTEKKKGPETVDMFERQIEKAFKKIENRRYLTRENAEKRLEEFSKEAGKFELMTQFEVVEIPEIDKEGNPRSIFKIIRKDDLAGGGADDEGVLTLEQEKARYEESQKFTGPRPEGTDTAGNRVGDVVSRELDFADTDTQETTKTKRERVGRTTDASRRPDARKVDSTNTLDFINKTDTKSPLRKPAIKKVLTDNPKILETATTDEITIGDTELNPNQYKREYKKWENKQKQNKELWKKRKGNKKQLIKDFEATIPSINNVMAEGLKPLQQERKVLDVAIREVVAEEYASYSKTNRSNLLKKFRKPKEAELEKKYQRVNKKYQKENNTKEDISPAEAARIVNDEKLTDRKKTKTGVTYFSDAKPQEFIKDEKIIKDINRKSFGLNKYKNFKTALNDAGLLDQYNKELDNIIANPPTTEGLPTEPGQAVPSKYAFETAEARDRFVKTAQENAGKEKRKPLIDNKGKSNTDFEVLESQDIVAVDLPGNERFKYTARVVTKPAITEQKRQQEERSAEEENAPDPTTYRNELAITNGEDLAQQELNTKLGEIQKVLEETIGKKGASVQEVLDALSSFAAGEQKQSTFASSKMAEVFNKLLNQKNIAPVFKNIKVVIDNKLKDKGKYNPKTETISINLELINQNQVQDVGPVVIHEVVHAMLDRVLLAKNFNKLNTSMQEAVTEIKRQYKLFQRLKKQQPNPAFKRASSLKEFVAMMFESAELAKAIAEAAAQQQIETETAIFEQGLGKQNRTADEFTDYIDSITGTRPIKSTLGKVAKVITEFFSNVMSALGLGNAGANRSVQDVIQNSMKIILDKEYSKIYGGISPGAPSNYGNKNTKNANKNFINNAEEKVKNKPKEKSFFKDRKLADIFADGVEAFQDVYVKIKTFTQKLSDGELLTVDNDITTNQTLVQGRASVKYKEAILPFINNMYLSYENFKSVIGINKPEVMDTVVNDLYEALGEYSRARWLFAINMPLSANSKDTFTIAKWKDETGKIGPWTGTPYEFREAILDRMSAAKEAEAKNQGSTNEIEKLRNTLDTFINSERQKALAIFKKGADKVLWQLPSPNRKSKDSVTQATRETFDPMSIIYSSGTLGVDSKETGNNIPSQVAAKELLKTIGINYDANLTPMTEQQLKENENVLLDKAKRDAFMQLAERIKEANDGIKEVNKENGYVPAQADNIINFMGFKYYKSLKRKNNKDKSVHKIRDERFLEGERASNDLNKGMEEKFAGGQQTSVNNVIAQTSSDGVVAAMRFGIQAYTQSIVNLSKDTVEITTKEGKKVKQPLADFLKFEKTYIYDDRYKLTDDKKLQQAIKDKKIILNFKNNGEIDVVRITREDMIIPLKGHITELNRALQYLARATSGIGQVHTRFSIPFGLTNFQRDFFTNIPLLIIKNPTAAIPYISNILGQVFRLNFITTWRYVRAMNRNDISYVRKGLKKPKNSYEHNLASYLIEGGMIAYVRGVSTASQSELLTKEIRKKRSILNTTMLTRVFDAWINTFEIAVRASAAKAVKPKLLKKALQQAKNPKPGTSEYNKIVEKIEGVAAATVKNFANFEQAGTKSAAIASWYMFFKPSMTSAVVNVRAIAPAFTSEQRYLDTQDQKLLQSPEYKKNALETFKSERLRAQAVVIGGGGLGYGLWTLLGALGDEEEQKKYKQDNMERWVRNIRIPLSWMPKEAKDMLGIKKEGSGDDMIQMHWGFGNMGWPAMGVQIASFVDGKFGTKNNPRLPSDFEFKDLFSNMTNIAMDNFLPLPISRSKLTDNPYFYFLDSIIPSVFKPIYEYTTNKDTFGYQITRQRSSTVGGAYGGSMTTEELYVNLAQFINENTRFNNEGAVQIDPNVLKFAANSYIDGFARIVSALSESGEITNLEDAKNRTLVFKQFFTRSVPVERDRYARMTKKLDNINMTNEQYKLDPTYIDKKGRDFDDFKLQNDVNLKNVVRYKETEKNLKRIYQEQKDYLKTITPEMRKLNSFEIKDNIENYKIRILKEMRQLTNHLELSDEDNRTPLFK